MSWHRSTSLDLWYRYQPLYFFVTIKLSNSNSATHTHCCDCATFNFNSYINNSSVCRCSVRL